MRKRILWKTLRSSQVQMLRQRSIALASVTFHYQSAFETRTFHFVAKSAIKRKGGARSAPVLDLKGLRFSLFLATYGPQGAGPKQNPWPGVVITVGLWQNLAMSTK
jgi:hypothetical protein